MTAPRGVSSVGLLVSHFAGSVPVGQKPKWQMPMPDMLRAHETQIMRVERPACAYTIPSSSYLENEQMKHLSQVLCRRSFFSSGFRFRFFFKAPRDRIPDCVGKLMSLD